MQVANGLLQNIQGRVSQRHPWGPDSDCDGVTGGGPEWAARLPYHARAARLPYHARLRRARDNSTPFRPDPFCCPEHFFNQHSQTCGNMAERFDVLSH
jgi:hypothetical protein